mgnify:CR=1 FL=1|tara:strand:- start:13 stop:1239 length:1227 start_codon:yes stop_codon:yes gene_type:complete
MEIKGQRLWDSLMSMAEIGATLKGGSCRLALTDEDKNGRDLFVSWCKDSGYLVTIDQIGNIFARRQGLNQNLPPVVLGSHLDTQPTGGRFDGVYGVLTGLEVLRTLDDYGIQTEHPIEVACWTNEEGSRFAPPMIASGVFAGIYDLDFALSRVDADGKLLGQELKRIGYAGRSVVAGRQLHAYFEVHIEQGPILVEDNHTIGVVTGAQGQRWYELVLVGKESHAGPTPMDRRQDALLGAARVVELINQVGLDFAPDACATVGMLNCYPNSRNVIPGRTFLTLDLRHPDDRILSEMCKAVESEVARLAEASSLDCDLQEIFYFAPVPFHAQCVTAVRNAANYLHYQAKDMITGAGHDACFVAKVAPTAMVFIPCIGGVSHNEEEDIRPEWATAGANVALHAVTEVALAV